MQQIIGSVREQTVLRVHAARRKPTARGDVHPVLFRADDRQQERLHQMSVENAVAIHAVDPAQTFSVMAHRSAFGSAGRNTFDKRSLGQKKKHQDRTNHQGGRTHQEVPRGGAQAGHEQLQAEGQRELVAVGQEDEWPNKVVPHKHEVQQGHHQQSRCGQRKHDVPENAEVTTAIDAGGIVEFSRDGHEELTHQEDAERVAKPRRNPQGPERPDEAKLTEHREQRNHDHGEQMSSPKISGLTSVPGGYSRYRWTNGSVFWLLLDAIGYYMLLLMCFYY